MWYYWDGEGFLQKSCQAEISGYDGGVDSYKKYTQIIMSKFEIY